MRRLFAAAVISVAGAVYAAMVGLPALAFAVTLAFAAFAVITCAAANRIVGDVAQTTAVSPAVDRHSLARHNALWFAVVFLWGGAVIALGYGLTPLYWQHWWQYALAMALLASISFGVARRLSRPAPSQRMLAALTKVTAIQGAAAAVGLIFLVISGKLFADKPDWLANAVFLAGGIAVATGSLIAVLGQRRAS